MSKGSQFPVNRTQFALVAAEALSIHKAQGSTCDSICVDLTKRGLSRELLYVALSRVTKLSTTKTNKYNNRRTQTLKI